MKWLLDADVLSQPAKRGGDPRDARDGRNKPGRGGGEAREGPREPRPPQARREPREPREPRDPSQPLTHEAHVIVKKRRGGKYNLHEGFGDAALKAKVGETVLIVSGSSARMASGMKDCPVDAAIVGIVDQVDVSG